MKKKKKYKNVKERLEIINKIIDYNKDAQNFFHRATKVDKKNRNERLKNVLERKQN